MDGSAPSGKRPSYATGLTVRGGRTERRTNTSDASKDADWRKDVPPIVTKNVSSHHLHPIPPKTPISDMLNFYNDRWTPNMHFQ